MKWSEAKKPFETDHLYGKSAGGIMKFASTSLISQNVPTTATTAMAVHQEHHLMPEKRPNAEVLAFEFASSLLNAHLDAIHETPAGRELVIDYCELNLTKAPEVILRDGHYFEKLQGEYVPRRLTFYDVSGVERVGAYEQLNTLPESHPARSLQGMIYWRAPDKIERFLIFKTSDEPPTLMFSAEDYSQESRSGSITPVTLERDFSSPPLLPVGPIVQPEYLYQKYGGDPVIVRINGQMSDHCLFVGGIREQPSQRPHVDGVLNVSEDPSAWMESDTLNPNDRWVTKGEGKYGMSLADLVAEAQWVVRHLESGHTILVHCSAGFNRSVTVCCAALILLEKISAEAALDRVREHHPWARPDGHHWLKLKGLASQHNKG